MAEEVKECPLCGGTSSMLFDRREFRTLPVTNRICSSCGMVLQSPRMSEAELKAFYEAEYRRLYQGDEGPTSKDLAMQSSRAEALLDYVIDRVGRPARHLDIGCSAGLLLRRFRDEFECQPVGVEPGEAYRSYAREQGLRVYASLEEMRNAVEEPADQHLRFDLVSMIHVLEHLPGPVEYLAGLREHDLSGAGWLLLEVPNLYGHECFEVAHLVSFSPHTLVQVVEKAGFEVVRLSQHGRPRSHLIPLYLTLLSRPATNGRGGSPWQYRPERGVKARRWYGMFRRRLVTRLFPRRAWQPIG